MKIIKESDDIIEFVEKIIDTTALKGYVEFRVLNNESQKALVTASKASATVEHFARTSPCVIVYVNEEVWYRLDDENMREMLVRDAIDGVSFDPEKDKLTVEKPQINISVGTWMKYGEKLVKAAETVVLTQKQIEEEKKEAKAAKKKGNK